MARHAQITQNNRCVISLQYIKKEVSDEVYFLHAYKHQSLLQVDFNALGIKVSLQGYAIIIDRDDQEFSQYFK